MQVTAEDRGTGSSKIAYYTASASAYYTASATDSDLPVHPEVTDVHWQSEKAVQSDRDLRDDSDRDADDSELFLPG